MSLADLAREVAPAAVGNAIEAVRVDVVISRPVAGQPSGQDDELGGYIRAPGGLYSPGRTLVPVAWGDPSIVEFETDSRGSWTEATVRTRSADGLVASSVCRAHRDTNAIAVDTQLRNDSANSLCLASIEVVVVELSSRYASRIRVLGGGTSHEVYPPPQYSVREYSGHGIGHEPLTLATGPGGRSSERDMPIVIGTVDVGGVVVGLEWSGQWRTDAHVGRTLRIRARADGQTRDLEPGHSIILPTACLVFFAGDLNAGSNAIRRHVRDVVMPQSPPHAAPPVVYDHWFGLESAIDDEIARRQANAAAALGAEVFVLDAGWFPRARGGDFHRGVGDWQPDPIRFASGIEPLARHVRSLGMGMGLWFEIERARHDSPVVVNHPDWFVDIGADHLHIDFGIPEARRWGIDTIGSWVERLELDWTRFDYNIEPLPYFQSDSDGRFREHIRGLYEVLDALIDRYPHLHIEACASGGRRLDLGVVRRSHSAWISDETSDSDICRFMQIGINHIFPGNFANIALPAEAGNQRTFTAADLTARMHGTFILSGDVASIADAQASLIASCIADFKAFRHLLVENFRRLTPQPRTIEDWDAALFYSDAGDEAVVLVHRGDGGPGSLRLDVSDLAGDVDFDVLALPWTGLTAVTTGRPLRDEGLEVAIDPMSSAVIRLISQSQG